MHRSSQHSQSRKIGSTTRPRAAFKEFLELHNPSLPPILSMVNYSQSDDNEHFKPFFSCTKCFYSCTNSFRTAHFV